jgi:hypothetical protein
MSARRVSKHQFYALVESVYDGCEKEAHGRIKVDRNVSLNWKLSRASLPGTRVQAQTLL